MQFSLLAVLLPLSLQDPAPPPSCPFDHVVPIEITATDPVLEGHGPLKRIPYTSEFSGTLHVRTKVEGEFETLLQVEDDKGELLAEVDDSDGKPTPYVRLGVEPGRKFVIAVAAAKPGATGRVQLHLVAARETEMTRAEAEHSKQELAEIKKLREAKDLTAARARVDALVEHLINVEGAAGSELIAEQAWDAGIEALAQAQFLGPMERAWRLTLSHCSCTLPDDHPDLQRVRINVAGTLHELGDLAGARPLEKMVLEVRSRRLPDDHPELQQIRENYANTIGALGDLKGARALHEKVLEIDSRMLSDDHPDLQRVRLNLAITLVALGDLARARSLDERVFEVLSRTLADDNPDLQKARENLAGTMFALGDVLGARALYEEVLQIDSRTLPDDHQDLQRARANLAITIQALGDFQGARTLEEKVLEVRSRTLPDEHEDIQTSRNNLAITLCLLDDPKPALFLFQKVLEVYSRRLPDDHPNIQQMRSNLAAAMKVLGDLAGARKLEEDVLEIDSGMFPDDHPQLQFARQNLAGTIAMQARIEKDTAGGNDRENGRERFADIVRSYIHGARQAAIEALLGASGREAEDRAGRGHDLDLALSMARGYGVFVPDPNLEQEAFLLSESTRSVGIFSARLERAARSEPRFEELRRKKSDATSRLASLAQSRGTREEFAAVRASLDRSDQDLVRLGAMNTPGALQALNANITTLSSCLGERDALVAYRRYTRSGFGANSAEESSECLCAFVVSSKKQFTRVELGPIEPVEEAIQAWRTSVGLSSGSSPSRGVGVGVPLKGDSVILGDVVRRLVLDPLSKALGDADHLVVALDDVLHLVPLDALPAGGHWVGESGDRKTVSKTSLPERLLGDTLRIDVRSSLLDVLATIPALSGSGTLMVLGNVEYDAVRDDEKNARPVATESVPTRETKRSGILRGGPCEGGFRPLPATRDEARGIAAIRKGSNGGDDTGVRSLEGTEASRENLSALAPKACFLHIATHGWFAPDFITSTADLEPIDAKMKFGMRNGLGEQVRGMAPMLLCGLALAGANQPVNDLGRIPGLITAQEIGALDLSNCELAVLSACDTNVGLRRAGQGVASLQKALHMAGARSVITSLWKVPDEATKDLMIDFYRRLWVEKKPKWQALWEAKMMIRNAKDEAGRPTYSTRDWAAWVLTGDPN